MSDRPSTAERLAPLTGLVFAIAFLVILFASGDSPNADAHTAKVINYWTKHKDSEMVTSLIAAIAFLFFAWFAGCLRARLALLEGGGRRLANTCFGGALIMTVGALLFSGTSFAAADTVGKVPVTVTQSIHVLNNDLFFPLAGGAALFLLAAGVLSLRTRALPAWLGWVAIVLGIVSVTPVGFFAILVAILWVAIVSVLLYLRPVEPAAVAPAV